MIVALIGGGGITALVNALIELRKSPDKGTKKVSNVEQSILTVARARDELEEDNRRLRIQISEDRKLAEHERNAHAEDRRQWSLERRSLQKEIQDLENQIRIERDESERRYDAILAQVARLSARHAIVDDGSEGEG